MPDPLARYVKSLAQVFKRQGLVAQTPLDKDFALKEFFPEDLVLREGTSLRIAAKPNSEADYQWGLRKFYDEARLLAQFNHSNIVNVRRVFVKRFPFSLYFVVLANHYRVVAVAHARQRPFYWRDRLVKVSP